MHRLRIDAAVQQTVAAATAIATIALANWPVPHVRVAAMLWHTELHFHLILHCRNCGLHYFRDEQSFGSRNVVPKFLLLQLPIFVVQMGGCRSLLSKLVVLLELELFVYTAIG